VINEVDIENYLKSTLTSQFPELDNSEVMESIAIVARTQAYFFVQKNPEATWHVEAAKAGYDGYGLVLQNVLIDKAIESTRHMVLTFENSPFAASWTKDSAGKTASFANIFRKNLPSPDGVAAPL